jgi:hypothetical protein
MLWAGNIYLTQTARPMEQLLALASKPADVARWKGTIHVWPVLRRMSPDISGWGACGEQIGDHLIFADPDLVHRVRQALTDD